MREAGRLDRPDLLKLDRLFDNLGGAAGIELEQVRAVEAPGVTHLKYRLMT